MKRTPSRWRVLACLVLYGAWSAGAAAQSMFDQTAFIYNTDTQRGLNLQSQRGVPLNNVSNPSAGSDGRNSMLPSAPTTNQFRGGIVFGAVTRQGTNVANLETSSFVANAVKIDWPRAMSGNQVQVVLRANAGAPYFSRQVQLYYGSVIPVPPSDLDGNLLTTVTPESYWFSEPFATGVNSATLEHTNLNYYWSAHAGKVFAVQPGPIEIVWRRSAALTNALSVPPAGYVPNVTHVLLGTSYYQLRKVQYVVSGLPVPDHRPRRMYWTKGIYAATGKMIRVPDGRVKNLKFVFNRNFAAKVPTNSVVAGPNINPDIEMDQRTIYYDNGFISAYNAEGRVFMELLGDTVSGPVRRHLGYELIDVQREAIPADVTVELGERVTAYPGNVPSDSFLEPSPIQGASPASGFAYAHSRGAGLLRYFAIRETQNISDYQVHWLEEGVEGLRWPFRFSRYKMVWPASPDRYVHYLRPRVDNESAAEKTAVALPTANVPNIEYEDPSDITRSKLTADYKFYTYLDPSVPRLRTLLRYNSGEHVAFERVFSILDTEVKAPRFTGAPIGLERTYLDLDPGKAPGAHANLPRSVAIGAGSFTLETWVFNRSVRSGSRVFDFGNGAGVDNIILGLSSGVTGRPFFQVYSNAVAGPALLSPDPVPLNQWVHLAVTFDGPTKTATLFVNASPVISGSSLAPRALTRTNNYVGRSNWPGDAYADAEFAAIRIWSTARSSTQLSDGMTAYVPSGTPNLLAQYLFNNSTPGADQSGNSANLSILGGTVISPRVRPRYELATAMVGQRLAPPGDETAKSGSLAYLAGHVHPAGGTPYSVTAYRDPLEVGFAAAATGSIIPVNATNNNATLEVWWFRPNAADASLGFQPVYWPSVISRYTLNWPTTEPQSRDLVLASNAGSGPLGSYEARGAIYSQNNRALPGYNPNEEHALQQGGQVWALRDDLNITSGPIYSSHPYVLLEFPDSDGRPSMSVFRVLRETTTVRFDYAVEAATLLQPPMPLPLMDLPLAPPVRGEPPRTLNVEAGQRAVRDLSITEVPAAVGAYSRFSIQFTQRHFYQPYEKLDLGKPGASVTRWLYTIASDPSSTNITAVASGLEPLSLGVWTASQPTTSTRYRYRVKDNSGLVLDRPVLVANPASPTPTQWVAILRGTNVVETAAYVEVEFAFANANANVLVQNASVLVIPTAGESAATFAGFRVAYERSPVLSDAAQAEFFARFTFMDRKGAVWVYRGPHREGDPTKLVMQCYYKTLPGFHFPSLADDAQPAVGTITPYLRPRNTDGSYSGDPVLGDGDDNGIGDGNPLGIAYHPVWPVGTPVLYMGESLTDPKRGLPGVRGRTSLSLLYQQSVQAGGDSRPSAELHDPTREREFQFVSPEDSSALAKIPDSVRTSQAGGKTYFPNLPPHLVERLFVDPNRGKYGALVFKGAFKDEALGDKYLLLNAIGPGDSRFLRDLCLPEPATQKAQWDAAITNGLVTVMQNFIEDESKPGTYKPDAFPVTVPPAGLSRVWNSDVAVDSYALTAVGPGIGYLTLVSGNGRAFTPIGEPVSMHVVRVSDTLYRGEVKVVTSSNPLNEKVTLEQVVDLAGRTDDFQFEWRIAAPENGFPPDLYLQTYASLLGEGTAMHVRYPLATDRAADIQSVPADRKVAEVRGTVVPISEIPFSAVRADDRLLVFDLSALSAQYLAPGNQLVVRDLSGREAAGTVTGIDTVAVGGQPMRRLKVLLDAGQVNLPASTKPIQLYERAVAGLPQSFLYREYTNSNTIRNSQYYLNLDLDPNLGAKVYVDGQLAVVANLDGSSATTTAPAGFPTLGKVYRIRNDFFDSGENLGTETRHRIAVELFSKALPGAGLRFDLRLSAFQAVDQVDRPGTPWLALDAAKFPDKVRTIVGEGADVRALSDNYIISRYRATNSLHASFSQGWSRWTEPALAEGWIKRVLAGINPFNQRVTDLFNNRVSTDVSLLTQAGPRWEGDVALSLESINKYGLIEIYETVLRRGRMLSIDAGINYGPANDALLLASGYLNDLYLMLGNEARADADNPTIGIGTKDRTYGDIATALFAFKGQVPSLLEEELALLRGRDDFLQPGVELRPVYNRLIWNYTRGIDAGEVIYANNYNIQENNDTGVDGVINADDARKMFPQAHGDAYGHYLTSLKGYYSLLIDKDFDWVPRIEAVNVLGKPVSVDYQDERKFAAAASAVARTGRQVFDLTWRRDFVPGEAAGWDHFRTNRVNTKRSVPTTRYWGADHWASRTMQGAYLNWAMGNSILPARDSVHEGIEQVDRTTVPELRELVITAQDLQTAVDNAEAHLTPLGLPNDGLAFDINPNRVTGANAETHFEQIYSRAKVALNNAMAAFDDAKDVTRLMRSEQDSLAEMQASVDSQERAYNNQLIGIYGTPYPDDIGPGRTYVAGYQGPDFAHYSYVEITDTMNPQEVYTPNAKGTLKIDIQNLPMLTWDTALTTTNWIVQSFPEEPYDKPYTTTSYTGEQTTYDHHYIEFEWGPHGFFGKPSTWTGQRQSPGEIQQAISEIIHKHDMAGYSLMAYSISDKEDLDKLIQLFDARTNMVAYITAQEQAIIAKQKEINDRSTAYEISSKDMALISGIADEFSAAIRDSIPDDNILGLAFGGDLLAPVKGSVAFAAVAVKQGFNAIDAINHRVAQSTINSKQNELLDLEQSINLAQRDLETKQLVVDLGAALKKVQGDLFDNNTQLRQLDDAQRKYAELLARGNRIQVEREIARRRWSAVIQGFRTRDAAFRIFRNEKLERYKTLFDLAARYVLLAANAYDYETGLLNTPKGRECVNRIVAARALGVVKDGEPQFAGSNTGDPGLSSVMAEMKADWDSLRGRLGFNNSDGYGTTVSLRTEHFRILPNNEGKTAWEDALARATRENLLDDADVRRHCLQIDNGDGLPVPGLVLEFGTTIADSVNLFGRPLAAGDHAFSPSSFATKLFGVGVAFEGYQGMDVPTALTGVITAAGAQSPPDPEIWYLNDQALAANPYVYLVPVGVDSMRSPPLGDASTIRTWAVDDITIPMPFNIGGSDFSTKALYQSADSLAEPLFAVRKHQAFRAVPTAKAFTDVIYGLDGSLHPNQYTNRRLIGRSVWNSKWKLVIPARTLLNDPREGLSRFAATVKDVKLHFITYSYSGN